MQARDSSLKELDLKIERLTVMVGTASFFMRFNPADGHSQSPASMPHDRLPQLDETRMKMETSKSSGDQDLPKLQEMVTTLATAVQAMQKHLVASISSCVRVRDSCRSECRDLRAELARQEASFLFPWIVPILKHCCNMVRTLKLDGHLPYLAEPCEWLLGILIRRNHGAHGAGNAHETRWHDCV